MSELEELDLVTLVGDIVSAFVSNNAVHVSDLPQLIAIIHGALKDVADPKPEPAPPVQQPAVPVKKSITEDYLICLEDGKRFKSLKRHLQRAFDLTPDAYRAKWGLSRDYPMVAPGYAAKRSQLAKDSGLGSDRRKAAQRPVETAAVSAPVVAAEQPAPRKRGRPRSKAEAVAA